MGHLDLHHHISRDEKRMWPRERGKEAEWASANWREGPRATNLWTALRSSLFIIGTRALLLTAVSALMSTGALRSPHVRRCPRAC